MSEETHFLLPTKTAGEWISDHWATVRSTIFTRRKSVVVVCMLAAIVIYVLTTIMGPSGEVRNSEEEVDENDIYNSLPKGNFISLSDLSFVQPGPGVEKTYEVYDMFVENLQSVRKFMTSELNKGKEIVDYWREAKPSEYGHLFLFSAYYDGRPKTPVVRIIAAALSRRKRPIYCIFLDTKDHFVQIKASVHPNSDDQSLEYCSSRIECKVPQGTGRPKWVTIVRGHNLDAQMVNVEATLFVHDRTPKNDTREGSFALCVKPLHENYNKATALTEFIELYRILGVEHFFLYNHTTGRDVQQVLKTYQKSGIVTLLPWQLDLKSKIQIRTEGLMVAFNDCMYRALFRYDYLVMVDFDEFIIPVEEVSYQQLVNQLQKPNINSFVFQNVFYYLNWKDDTEWLNAAKEAIGQSNFKESELPRLVTLAKTKRISTPTEEKRRSKYIARPDKLIAVGNHFAEVWGPGTTEMLVPPSIGLSHHYRLCEFGGSDCVHQPNLVNRITWRYVGELIPRVLRACAAAFPSTGKCPTDLF